MTDIAAVKPAVPTASTPAAGVLSFQGPTHAPSPPSTPEHLQRQLDEAALILQSPSETALAIARRLAATGSLLDVRA